MAKDDAYNRRQREPFAMLPESLITGSIPGADRNHAGLVYLYSYLDLRQGKDGRPARNITRIAEALGYQTRTIMTWATILADAGIVKIIQRGHSAVEIVVVNRPGKVAGSIP